MIALILILVVMVVVIASCIKMVPQTQNYIIERLGLFRAVWTPGLHTKFPFIDKVAKKVDMREQVIEIPLQPIITKDNKTVGIEMGVFFQVTDPRLFTYAIGNGVAGIEQLTTTTLRNIVGELNADQTLSSREMIHTKMLFALDEATNIWGVRINRVEILNMRPPA